MELKDNKIIAVEKIPNELDKLVLKFFRIIEKYTEYVVVSGYVSILLGRSRSTEDIDAFVKPMNREVFSKLYEDLKNNGFWCLNAESENEVYSYLKDGLAVRFAEVGGYSPNFEVKYPKDDLDEESFSNYLIVVLEIGDIKISSLERQIAFKRYYLASDKDIEDALHVEELFKEKIDYNKVDKYRKLIKLKRGL